MNKIDVFFKFLENADKKGREVTFKDYGNENISIVIFRSDAETEKTELHWGVRIAEIRIEVRQSLFRKQSRIHGYFRDIETKEEHKFSIHSSEWQYKYYELKFTTAVEKIKIEQLSKKDEEYQRLLEREVNIS